MFLYEDNQEIRRSLEVEHRPNDWSGDSTVLPSVSYREVGVTEEISEKEREACSYQTGKCVPKPSIVHNRKAQSCMWRLVTNDRPVASVDASLDLTIGEEEQSRASRKACQYNFLPD